MSFTHPTHIHTAFATALASGDVDALLALYEAGAVQLQQDGIVLTGADSLRDVFTGLLAAGVSMQGEQRLAVVADDVALTSTRYAVPGGGGPDLTMTTAEVSRRQPDGSWRVVIDAPTFA